MFHHGPYGWMQMARARNAAYRKEAEDARRRAVARRGPLAWFAGQAGRSLVRLGESLVSAGCRLSRLEMLKREPASHAMGRSRTS